MTRTTFELIGAPTDIGASVRGAGMGPDALRVAGIAEMLARLGLGVLDRGNLSGPATPWAQPSGGLRHLDEVVAWNRSVYDAVDAALGAGHVPLLMGGDHCLAVGPTSAVAWHARQRGRKLRVLWFDAHTDVNNESSSPSGNLHGMRLPPACWAAPGGAGRLERRNRRAGARCAALHRHPQRRRGREGGHPQPGPAGLRHAPHRRARHAHHHDRGAAGRGRRHPPARELRPRLPRPRLRARRRQPGVRGGPTYREMQLCMEMVADTGRLASLDVVELNPALDVRNRTAEVAVELIESLFGKSTLAR